MFRISCAFCEAIFPKIFTQFFKPDRVEPRNSRRGRHAGVSLEISSTFRVASGSKISTHLESIRRMSSRLLTSACSSWTSTVATTPDLPMATSSMLIRGCLLRRGLLRLSVKRGVLDPDVRRGCRSLRTRQTHSAVCGGCSASSDQFTWNAAERTLIRAHRKNSFCIRHSDPCTSCPRIALITFRGW